MKKISNYIQLRTQTQKLVFFLIMLLSVTLIANAQPPDVGGDVDNVPIDGGLSLLVAAGVGYGAKKVRRLKQK